MNALVATASPSRVRLGVLVAVVVIALDQLTKWLVLNVAMQPFPRVIEVTPFFNIVLTWNQGVSFGMFSHEAEFMPYVLSAVALAIAAVLAGWLRRAETAFAAFALGLVIGGAAGNVLDRLVYGAVVDFLDFHLAGWHFWAFNIADSGISVGVTLLVIDGLFANRGKA